MPKSNGRVHKIAKELGVKLYGQRIRAPGA
jgi:hypothetical protein